MILTVDRFPEKTGLTSQPGQWRSGRPRLTHVAFHRKIVAETSCVQDAALGAGSDAQENWTLFLNKEASRPVGEMAVQIRKLQGGQEEGTK